MATLTPSLNGAGVPLPPNPANPPSLADIKSAKEYIDWLSFSKGQPAYQLNAATDGEIGAAEAYKMAVIFAHSPVVDVAPPWLVNMNTTVQRIVADVAFLWQKSEEMPIQLVNS